MSNEKQLGLGFLQYTQDFDEKYPFCQDWAPEILPYIKSPQLYRCPDDAVVAPAGTYPISYGMNGNASYTSTAAFIATARTGMLMELTQGKTALDPGNYGVVDFTAQTPATFEASPYGTGIAGCTSSNAAIGYSCNDSRAGAVGGRNVARSATQGMVHDPGSNFLAADGHVKFLHPEMVSSGPTAAAAGCAQDGVGCQTAVPYATTNAASTDVGTYQMTFSTL